MVRFGWYRWLKVLQGLFFHFGCERPEKNLQSWFQLPPLKKKMKKISGHIKSRQSVVSQRFPFRQQEKMPGETLPTFASALQELAAVCAFGCQQQELVLDQLMDRAADQRIWEKLLMELGTLTVAQAVELGSHMERVLQKNCPGFISAVTKQWENCSSNSKIWKIRNYNCCNQWYCWRQRRPPALTTKYDQEKQNQFIPFCHSPMSSAPVVRRQHLGWPVRCPANTSNRTPRRVRNMQVGCWLHRAWDRVKENRQGTWDLTFQTVGLVFMQNSNSQLSCSPRGFIAVLGHFSGKLLSRMKVLQCYMLDFCSFSFARLKSCMKAFGEVLTIVRAASALGLVYWCVGWRLLLKDLAEKWCYKWSFQIGTKGGSTLPEENLNPL